MQPAPSDTFVSNRAPAENEPFELALSESPHGPAAPRAPVTREAEDIAAHEVDMLETKHPLSSGLREKIRKLLAQDAADKLESARVEAAASSSNPMGSVLREARAARDAEEKELFTMNAAETDAEVRRLLEAPGRGLASDLSLQNVSLFARIHAAHQRHLGKATVADQN
jgi:hypothetical protein